MRILSGWKEIAAHLHQGVRTVQRWEALGLPVHRVRASARGPVVAFVEELEAWESASPTRLRELVRELQAKVASLESEVRSLKRQWKPDRTVAGIPYSKAS
jgi:hypothetical protein